MTVQDDEMVFRDGASGQEASRDLASRDGALARALAYFDCDGFRDRLAELVAIPSTSQDPGHEADVRRYLADAILPWLQRMGFEVEIHPNPAAGFGPILFAERLEGADRPTVLTYGHVRLNPVHR
jgi:acetylornithine deacetylase/succinyl-diaminopimelate desuccinylase-like protein